MLSLIHIYKNEKEMVIESEKGSVYPRADFMKEIEEAEMCIRDRYRI